MTDEQDMLSDPSFQRWLDETARHCRQCSLCWSVPCGGCQQGAPCDALPCRCDADDDRDDYCQSDDLEDE